MIFLLLIWSLLRMSSLSEEDQPYLIHYNVKTGKQRYFSSLDSLPSNLKNKVVDEFSSSKGKKKRSVLYLADK